MVSLIIVISLYITASLILLGYGIQCYVLTYLFLRKRKTKIAEQHEKMKYYYSIPVEEEKRFPKVVTQLPMYNEKSVARRAILAAAVMDYPASRYEVQVLDDSTDETREIIDKAAEEVRRKGVKISVIRRENRNGFKAGALQEGLKYTDAEFVAIFDADFVPPPDFVKKSLAFFVDNPQLGLVQSRWTHLNRTASLLTRTQAMGIDGHFMIEQAARSWNGLFMNFNGTAGIFRRKAIENAGGWEHDTLTEDMDLSYRMQLAGWKTEYVPDLKVPAEIPEDINAFKNQQFRWAKGSIQTAMKIIPLLFQRKIPFFTMIQAVLHLTHYMVHPLMLLLAILSLPMLYYVKVSLPPVIFVGVVCCMILATSGPSTMYMVSQYYCGNKVWKTFFMLPVMMLVGTGLAVNNGKAVIEALLKLTSPFHRTPKKGELKGKVVYRPIKDITCILEILLGCYCLFSFKMFLAFTNFLVSPFLMIYASGFIFVGLLSIIHYRHPELIDLKVKQLGIRKV